jgi:hypothetical protein
MKKINVDKSEGVAEVIDRVLAIEDSAVLLVIPKGSALAKSASNFRLLKREATAADKTIAIESGDEDVVSFAEMNAIEMVGAFDGAKNGVSDIVPKSMARGSDEAESPARKKTGVRLTVQSEGEDDDDDDGDDKEETADEKEEEKMFSSENRFFKPRTTVGGGGSDDDDDARSGGGGKAFAWIVGIIVVLGAIFYGVTIFLGHAQVTIDFTQTPWNYQGSFIADQNATAIETAGTTASSGSIGTVTIPAQIFTTQKNITQLFPATGPSVNGATKAQGTITIYNDYSSASQELVATTRFVTPNGQIFRLVNDVTIPGATVSANGVITPSSITAPIIADQGGSAYNVGPIAKLTVFVWGPGQSSANPAKYAGFYGAITGTTTGGGSGSHPVPSASDIAAAKASTTAILQADLQSGLTGSYTNNFKILDGATDIQVGKLTVNTSTDANGNFSVFGEASLTAIGFDETALENYLLAAAESAAAQAGAGADANVTSTFKTVNLSYSNVQADFTKGQVSFSLSGTGSIEPAFSPGDFAASLAGESISSARTTIASLPELSNGTISVWPVWLWNMPSDAGKIEVTAN